MPSYARQGIRVIKRKNPKNNGSYILIAKKTGYVNVTINGKQYYYNRKASYPMTTRNAVKKTVTAKSSKKPKAKTIVIRRKR